MLWFNKPQFFGVRAAASNIGYSRRNYTATMFQKDFPQFFKADGTGLVPPAILKEFIRQAGAAIQPDKWLDGWRYACGLYVAHNAALYLRTWSEGSDSPAQAAASGALVGVVKSAQLADFFNGNIFGNGIEKYIHRGTMAADLRAGVTLYDIITA
ncbi:MAG: DUF4054 domain-containing protein [Ruminococcus sp.]|nr:DUF4054 domain-containing protein [Ruminococcus sp.]